MSKILDASCEANLVTIDDLPVDGITILSKGVGASEGVVVLEKEVATYITSNASDIEDLIVKLKAIVDQIVLIVTNLDAVTLAPGSAAALIVQLNLLGIELDLSKETLK